MLKHNDTYEIMKPDMVGLSQSRLVLGKHSGRHAFRIQLAEMGYELTDEELERTFVRFKELADRKKIITETDLEAIVSDQIAQPVEVYCLDGLQVSCGSIGMPTATVRLGGPDGKMHVHAEVGTGPVDAAFSAIDAIVQAPTTLLEYSVNAITEGIDAIGEVSVRLQAENGDSQARKLPQNNSTQMRTYGGHGVDTDIIVASVKAYLSALNKLLVASGNYRKIEKAAAEQKQTEKEKSYA